MDSSTTKKKRRGKKAGPTFKIHREEQENGKGRVEGGKKKGKRPAYAVPTYAPGGKKVDLWARQMAHDGRKKGTKIYKTNLRTKKRGRANSHGQVPG